MKRALMAAAAMVFCSGSLLSAQPTAPADTIPEAPGGILTCPILMLCQITLGPGEALVQIYGGDTHTWQTKIQADETERVHLLIKANEPGASTNMVVFTDKRHFEVQLRSPPSEASQAKK